MHILNYTPEKDFLSCSIPFQAFGILLLQGLNIYSIAANIFKRLVKSINPILFTVVST